MTHGGRDMTKAEIAAQFQTTARDAATAWKRPRGAARACKGARC